MPTGPGVLYVSEKGNTPMAGRERWDGKVARALARA